MDDWSVLITGTERVYRAVRAGYLNVVQVSLIFKGLITNETVSSVATHGSALGFVVSCGIHY